MNAPAETIAPPPADLAAEIDAADNGSENLTSTPGEPLPAGAVPADYDFDNDARELVTFAYEAFVPLYPSIAGVWHEERRGSLTRALGGLMRKRGWTAETLFIGWGAELTLAMVVIPAVVPTVRAIQADEAKRKAEAEQKKAAERPQPPAADDSKPPAPKLPDL